MCIYCITLQNANFPTFFIKKGNISLKDGRVELLNLFLGDDEVLKDSLNFAAIITASSNKEDVWNLLMM